MITSYFVFTFTVFDDQVSQPLRSRVMVALSFLCSFRLGPMPSGLDMYLKAKNPSISLYAVGFLEFPYVKDSPINLLARHLRLCRHAAEKPVMLWHSQGHSPDERKISVMRRLVSAIDQRWPSVGAGSINAVAVNTMRFKCDLAILRLGRELWNNNADLFF